ncbi:hypothetical protein CDD83_8101 [Cordyceps sp. RAO-2017]|nr:hypothetical protein CDD83_8101 [Cordyceps sp. RAO-2017]
MAMPEAKRGKTLIPNSLRAFLKCRVPATANNCREPRQTGSDSLGNGFKDTNARLLDLYEAIDDATDVGSSPTSDRLGRVEAELYHALSLHSQISTAEDAPSRDEASQKIGAGACGAVFPRMGTPWVLELAKAGRREDLWNDFAMLKRISSSFDSFPLIKDLARVPDCLFFVPANDRQFFLRYPTLADAAEGICNMPTAVLVSERIWPLPKRTRRRIVEKYCAAKIKRVALTDPVNGDCLLGLTTPDPNAEDAAGLASLAPHYTGPESRLVGDFYTRTTELWVLDFNQVKPISLDEAGVAQAVNAAKVNDPYMPRPHKEYFKPIRRTIY